jgi:type I restriction enzyme S subunit
VREGWQLKTITDVCSIVNGGTPKTNVSEYWDGSHQWVTPAEMGKRSTPYIATTERTITDAGMKNSDTIINIRASLKISLKQNKKSPCPSAKPENTARSIMPALPYFNRFPFFHNYFRLILLYNF